MSATTPGPVLLRHGNYTMAVDVSLGSSVLSLDWTAPDGQTHALFVPSCAGGVPFKAGCFVMAPFANRIAGGSFPFNGRIIRFPVNQIAENNAIHGLSRDRKWVIMERTASRLSTLDECRDAASGYHYDLTQLIEINAVGVSFALTITNRGSGRLPFGLGCHPWFTRTRKARLAFRADTGFTRNESGLPEATRPTAEIGDFSAPVALGRLPWLDAHYAGWLPRTALLDLPEMAVRIALSASGCLRNLHIFAPDDRAVICIEPVSHVPNVCNAPAFARFGDLAVLEPGESLSGSMRIAASSFESSQTHAVGDPHA
jgi:aldose 1-epimerase